MPISIAIVEDDRAVRASLAGILQRAADCRCVGDFGSAEEALRKLPALRPDVILMDINLPDMSGVECVRQLSQRLPATRILMLTVQEDPDCIFNSLAAGASGYLLKPVRAAELVAAVKDVFRGGAPMTSIIARKVVQSFKQAGAVARAKRRIFPRGSRAFWTRWPRATVTRKPPTSWASATARCIRTSSGFTRNCMSSRAARRWRSTWAPEAEAQECGVLDYFHTGL